MDDLHKLTAISAVDGRYRDKVERLAPITSEFGLIKFRVQVECEWVSFLSQSEEIVEIDSINHSDQEFLKTIHKDFSVADANEIKKIEQITNHDVKAVEYFIKSKMKERHTLLNLIEWVHFGCTSEDINNTSYAMMLSSARSDVLLKEMSQVIKDIENLSRDNSTTAMLSRTHGQIASPTTLGKELRNTSERLRRQLTQFEQIQILGKFNGAVGNFNAHHAAYPEIDWLNLSARFIDKLGLVNNPYTTQIEPHDYIAELFDCLNRFNQVLLDFNRDIWSYVSINYFKQKKVEGETGSSTMPHKINPIDFENSEGNLGVAHALLSHMSSKLPVSRLQRDLTDSTVLRNIGSALAHCLIAYKSTRKGLSRLEVNKTAILEDLSVSWEVLAEPVQTVMRKYNLSEPYERLKEVTRGRQLTESVYRSILEELDLPKKALSELKSLRPENYLGLAIELSEASEE